MNISFNQNSKGHLDDYSKLISKIIRNPINQISRINEGRNSRVYSIDCKGSKKYIAKVYFTHKYDKRDRLTVEFSCSQFLWNKGIRCIPQPISVHKNSNLAIYEYIEGTKISSQSITDKDIDVICSFLIRLSELGKEEDSKVLPTASEACFSVKEIVEGIKIRHQRLLTASTDSKNSKKNSMLYRFQKDEFLPEFDKITKWCISSLVAQGFDYSLEINKKNRTLSPSDFGFHNAIRRKDNKIIFLDFEYFGWDDPAKMIADFLLHPNMHLKPSLKKQFVRNMVSYFPEGNTLQRRLAIAYPLVGLKWCLILLNEFLPEYFLRRKFANTDLMNIGHVQSEQLLKAQNLLHQIANNYKNFPYGVE